MKLAIMGDFHASSATPRSRTDDFPESCVAKLEEIRRLCEINQVSYLVFLGDFYHTYKQPFYFINKIVDQLRLFKDSGIKVYTICGNSHDVPYDKIDYLPRTALGVTLNAGVMELLDYQAPLKFYTDEGYSVCLYGYAYEQEIRPVMELNPSKINICAMHRGVDAGYHDDLTKEQLTRLGYNIYLSGHIHTPYPVYRGEGYFLVRPGRVMRYSSESYNVTEPVYMDIINLNGSKENPRVTFIREELDIPKGKDVFLQSSIEKYKPQSLLDEVAYKYDILMEKLVESKESSLTVYDILDQLDIPKEVKVLVETYLSNHYIMRESHSLEELD